MSGTAPSGDGASPISVKVGEWMKICDQVIELGIAANDVCLRK